MAVYNTASHKCLKLTVEFTHYGCETHKNLLRQVANIIFLTVVHMIIEQVTPTV